MTIIGTPQGVARPFGYLQANGARLEITSFDASFTVGNIPVARVGLLPEDVAKVPAQADDTLYDVYVADGPNGTPYLMFRGYVSGDHRRLSPTEYRAGVDLIHVARDLDEMRLSAPSLHPQGVNDWSYQRAGSSRVAGQGGIELSTARFFTAADGRPLPRQVIDELVRYLGDLQVKVQRNNPAWGLRTESLQPAIDLLKKLQVTQGGTVKGELAQALAGTDRANSINGYLVDALNESLVCQRSIWDALSAAFAAFGFVLVCDNAGNTFVFPDLANFQPPDDNLLDGAYMVTRDQASSFCRRIGEVVLISQSVQKDPGANGAPEDQQSYAGTVASWPPPASQGGPAQRTGATLALLFPGWLSPISYVVDASEFEREPPNPSNPGADDRPPADTGAQRQAVFRAQQAYAHMLYNLETDKKRTFSLTGPLAPLAFPGTTVRLRPESGVRARTTGEAVGDAGVEYSAYLYQVSHCVQCGGGGGTLATTFCFRNVSRADEGLGLTGHPIYGDCRVPVLQ